MNEVVLVTMLLFGITFLAVVSNKFKFPFPIVLVLSGLVISIIPGLPSISLQPEIVFLIFLPPLLYEAAWKTNWHNFKSNKRPILLAAFGLVLFTTLIVGAAAHYFIPGVSWPLGFLLGAIVSPTDAVAATSLTRNLRLSPKIITILEGESLVNDASGLVAYKYAVSAVMAGNFVFWQAGLNFLIVIAGSVATGLLTGYIARVVLKRIRVDNIIQTTITFIIPFTSYLIAEQLHISGVLAVVCTGIYLSYNAESIITHQARITIYSVWQVISFILNGLIFILIGLQLKIIMEGIKNYSTGELITYGLLISFVVIICRFVFVVPAVLLPRMLSKKIRDTESFNSRNMWVFGFAGIRGVVSLAAALSLPVLLPGGAAFPERNLIIYLTFCVILSTLVLLGLNLPTIIRRLKLPVHSMVAEEYEVRSQIITNTIKHIEENLSSVREEFVSNLKTKYDIKNKRIQRTDLPADYFGKDKPDDSGNEIFNEYSQLELDILDVERRCLNRLNREGRASEEIVRKIERELDLEQARLGLELHD
ncbi:MAG: Na+/H+ antiporter [Ginsengibacter sp.]